MRLVLIGLVAGFFSALFGVGGGIVIVPLLLLFCGWDSRAATATSLARHNATNSLPHMSLSAILQKEFIDLPDKVLLESMKEEASVAQRREQLTKAIERMEKAMAVFDAL